MDPVRTGFVDSLAQPGGNITGLTVQGTDLQGKALQLLKEPVPTRLPRGDPMESHEPGRRVQASEAEDAARAFGAGGTPAGGAQPRRVGQPLHGDGPRAGGRHPRDPSQLIGARAPHASPHSRYRAVCRRWAIRRAWVEAGGLMSYGCGGTLICSSALRTTSTGSCEGRRRLTCPWSSPCGSNFPINLKTAMTLGLTLLPDALLPGG